MTYPYDERYWEDRAREGERKATRLAEEIVRLRELGDAIVDTSPSWSQRSEHIRAWQAERAKR